MHRLHFPPQHPIPFRVSKVFISSGSEHPWCWVALGCIPLDRSTSSVCSPFLVAAVDEHAEAESRQILQKGRKIARKD